MHDAGKPSTLVRADRIRFHGHERVGAQMTREAGRRLRLPLADAERAAELVDQHLRFLAVREMRPATLKRFLRQPGFDELLELHRLDSLASNGDLSNHDFCVAQLAELGQEALAPAPLLRGNDLLALGYAPGPPIGRILEALETAQLEGEILTRAEAEAWVLASYPLRSDGR